MTLQIVTLSRAELAEIIRQTAQSVADDLRDDIESQKTLELMTKAELAEYLRCDVSKVNRYMTKGLPFFYFGDHPRFRKSDIDGWLNERVQKISGQADLAKG